MSNDEIVELIDKIRERFDQVYEPSGNIVRIEVDLMRADIRELYEKVSTLTLLQSPAAVPQVRTIEPEAVKEEAQVKVESVPEPEPVRDWEKKEDQDPHVEVESFPQEPAVQIEAKEPVVQSAFIPEPELTIFSNSTVPEPVLNSEMPGETVPPVVSPPPVQQTASEPAPAVHVHETNNPVHSTLDLFGAPTTTLADKFRDEKHSINDKLHLETTSDQSIGSKLRLRISDLRSAIGINDRFIFINELFEGDMRRYDDMLGRINSCSSLQEAVEVFNHAKATQGWSDELSSVERLLDFIHRRFA